MSIVACFVLVTLGQIVLSFLISTLFFAPSVLRRNATLRNLLVVTLLVSVPPSLLYVQRNFLRHSVFPMLAPVPLSAFPAVNDGIVCTRFVLIRLQVLHRVCHGEKPTCRALCYTGCPDGGYRRHVCRRGSSTRTRASLRDGPSGHADQRTCSRTGGECLMWITHHCPFLLSSHPQLVGLPYVVFIVFALWGGIVSSIYVMLAVL